MILWQSEDETPTPVKNLSIQIGDEDWAFVVDSYESTGSRTTSIMFFGENDEENSKKWTEYVYPDEAEEDDYEPEFDYNTDTTKAIKDCFEVIDA